MTYINQLNSSGILPMYASAGDLWHDTESNSILIYDGYKWQPWTDSFMEVYLGIFFQFNIPQKWDINPVFKCFVEEHDKIHYGNERYIIVCEDKEALAELAIQFK